MIQDIFDWFGQLDIYGIDPALVATIGFGLLLFAISEFFRLFELILSHLTKR